MAAVFGLLPGPESVSVYLAGIGKYGSSYVGDCVEVRLRLGDDTARKGRFGRRAARMECEYAGLYPGGYRYRRMCVQCFNVDSESVGSVVDPSQLRLQAR